MTYRLAEYYGYDRDTAGNYDIGDWGMVAFPIKDFDFSNFNFPDGKSEGRYNTAIKVMDIYKDRFCASQYKESHIRCLTFNAIHAIGNSDLCRTPFFCA